MKTLARNDVLELLEMGIADTRPQISLNALQTRDDRAIMAFELLKTWGATAAMGDVVNAHELKEGEAPKLPAAPQELVMRTCEVVDALWSEMQHRGWILQSKPMGS